MPATRAKALPYQRPIKPEYKRGLRPEDRSRLLNCFPGGTDQSKAEEAVDALPTIVALFRTGLDTEWGKAQRKILGKSIKGLNNAVTALSSLLDGPDEVTRRRILRALAGGPIAGTDRRKKAEVEIRQFSERMQKAIVIARGRLPKHAGRPRSSVEWLVASIQKNWTHATGREFTWFQDAKRSPEAALPRQYAKCVASVFKLKYDVLAAYRDGEDSKDEVTRSEAIHVFDVVMDSRSSKVKEQKVAGDESDASDRDS